MIKNSYLIRKTIGLGLLFTLGLVFNLLTGCQTPPKWALYEGQNDRLYPGEH